MLFKNILCISVYYTFKSQTYWDISQVQNCISFQESFNFLLNTKCIEQFYIKPIVNCKRCSGLDVAKKIRFRELSELWVIIFCSFCVN